MFARQPIGGQSRKRKSEAFDYLVHSAIRVRKADAGGKKRQNVALNCSDDPHADRVLRVLEKWCIPSDHIYTKPPSRGNDMTKKTSKHYFLTAAVLALVPYALMSAALRVHTDSGVFMYTGSIIADGGMPYTDSWDHKGPLLYLFNALGYYLSGGPRGVIALEGVCIFIALFISMRLWSTVVSPSHSMVIAALFMGTFYSTFEGGNYTESWLMPFLLLTYSIGFVNLNETKENNETKLNVLFSIMLGVSLAVAILTRPNNGMGLLLLALIAFFLSKGRRIQLSIISSISFLAVFVPVLLWIELNGAFANFLDQYVIYNFAYSSGATLRERYYSAHQLLEAIFFSPLALVSLCVSMYGLLAANGSPGNRRLILPIVFTSIFFTDVASQLISGRGYPHYISLSSSALALVLVSILPIANLKSLSCENLVLKLSAGAVFMVVFILTLIRPMHGAFGALNSGVAINGSSTNTLASYLSSRTTSSDLILVHGAGTWLLAVTDRRSPTTITYFNPTRWNFNGTYVKYENEVLSSPPLYIVEAPGGCGLIREVCPDKIQKYERIARLVDEKYYKEAELNDHVFWRLKQSSANAFR